MKPSVSAVSTADANLNVEGMPCRYRTTPQTRDGREITGVHEYRPVLQFLERLPRIVQERFVDEFDLACRRIGTEETGDAIDHQA